MTYSDVRDTIAEHEQALRAMGVRRLELFGSVAHGTATQNSDIDLLVELEPFKGLFSLCAIEEYLETLFHPQKVELVLRKGVYEELQQSIMEGAMPCLVSTEDSASLTS